MNICIQDGGLSQGNADYKGILLIITEKYQLKKNLNEMTISQYIFACHYCAY